jgi:cobalamin biosynthesis Mg chelatase CobN
VITVPDAEPSEPVSSEPVSSEPAASRIANMVKKLKAKVAFGGQTTPQEVVVTPENTQEASVSASTSTSNTSVSQDAPQSSYWLWLAVGAAVLVLLLLWVILRRTSKSAG